MNKQQLIDNATAKNFRIEFDENQYGQQLIGINKNKWSYHWFNVYDNEVYYSHTYSQLTGKTKKGMKHRWSVCESLGYYNN
jgi:hypothetical protein